MKHQITKLSVHQNAKIVSVIYAGFGLVISVLLLAGMVLGQEDGALIPDSDSSVIQAESLTADAAGPAPRSGNSAGGVLIQAVLLPLFAGIAGYLSTALACVIFNFVARRLGGIEFEMNDEPMS